MTAIRRSLKSLGRLYGQTGFFHQVSGFIPSYSVSRGLKADGHPSGSIGPSGFLMNMARLSQQDKVLFPFFGMPLFKNR